MARLSRVAASAVLAVALSLGICANAESALQSAAPAARLSLARVFDPNSEALLPFALAASNEMSLLSRVVFNLALPETIAIANVSNAVSVSAPSVNVSDVNVGGIEPVKSFTVSAPVEFTPAPQIAAPPLQVPSGNSYDAVTAPPRTALHAPVPKARAIASASTPTPARFGSYAAYAPSYQDVGAKVAVPVRVGGMHFSGIFSGAQSQTSRSDAFRAMQLCGTTDEAAACPYLHESSARTLVAGTDFNVRAGNRDVNVQLSSTLERRSNNDAAIFPYVPLDPDTQVGVPHLGSAGPDTSMLSYPGLTDVVKHGVDARLAVPISQRLTVGLQYDSAHYQGDYATTMVPGLDARKDTYLGNVTYQLPNTSSAITFSARKYLYQDTYSPNFNLTQTRADLNFTVKF